MALHKDLQAAHYDSEEMHDIIPPQNMLYDLPRDSLDKREESFDSDNALGEESQEGSDRAPSLDAIYYDDDYPMAGRRGRKYKRKDYSSLVPLGGLRRSGRLKANH